MLDHLDLVLSFAAVMLGVSMIITVLTQAVSSALNLRGRQLAKGLAELFGAAGLDTKLRAELSTSVLSHSLLADGALWSRLAPAVRKQDLLHLLELMKKEQAFKELEVELSRAKAMAATWFDSTMDRVSHRFAGVMRWVTVVFSFAVAFGLHLDSLELVKRLGTDAELRQSLVGVAGAVKSRAEGLGASVAAVPAAAATATAADTERLLAGVAGLRTDLEASEFRLVPEPYPGLDYAGHWLGIIGSAMLLSLGAPFWFNVLSSLSSLRPAIAGKADAANRESPG